MKYFYAPLAATLLALLGQPTPTSADDTVVNTPVVIASLRGRWELQPKPKDEYKQTLSFDGSRCGQWQQRKGTLPVSITFYVEGNELLIQHYYEPNGAHNYRLKQRRFDYELDDQTLTLKRDGVSQTWKRVKEPDSK